MNNVLVAEGQPKEILLQAEVTPPLVGSCNFGGWS